MATRNSATPTGQLGLISCKFGANPAADKPASFRNVCLCLGDDKPQAAKMGALKCPTCDQPPTGKAREVSKDTFVVVPKTELDALAEEAKKFKGSFAINPHPAAQMTEMLPAPDGKVYVLHPYDASQALNYWLLLLLVRKRTDLAFTLVWAVSTSPAMYRMQEYKGRLILVELAWPASIRDLPAVDPSFEVQAELMLAMAESFVDTLVSDFDPSTYKDSGRERLEQIIAASTPVSSSTGTPVAPQGVGDLMAALKAAVDNAPAKAKVSA